ncbi:MAG TPA: hypothetical protein VMH04_19840 [Candidatus Solibacter sp.]|nr:hypothetical protein [Candidatus Solibacter sp.]
MMKNSIHRSLLLIFAAALAAMPLYSQTDAQKAFTTIKSMPGTWEGKVVEGHDMGSSLQVTFKVVSGGTAVMSEILGHEDMVSMFNMDGNRLLLTHYCAIGNQPRMEASASADGKTITFNYVDATNLASPDAGHMERMVLTLLDDNHHTEEWTFIDHGKEHRSIFDLHRKM